MCLYYNLYCDIYAQGLRCDIGRPQEHKCHSTKDCTYISTYSKPFFINFPKNFCYISQEIQKFINLIVYLFYAAKCSSSQQLQTLVFGTEIKSSCPDKSTHDIHYNQSEKIPQQYSLMTCRYGKISHHSNVHHVMRDRSWCTISCFLPKLALDSIDNRTTELLIW